MTEFRFLNLLGATGRIRREMLKCDDGKEREHLVVPVVALVEGAIRAMNSKGFEMVRAERFALAPSGWNGRPLVAGHPVENGSPISANDPRVLSKSFGRVFNSKAHEKRLLMEAWIDIDRAKGNAASNRVLERCLAHERGDVDAKPIEVSVGAYVGLKDATGTWGDRNWTGEWDTIIPDHLALLAEDQVGACSIAMGCGALRAAMLTSTGIAWLEGEQEIQAALRSLTTKDNPMAEKGLLGRLATFLRALMPRGWGDDEVKQELRDALLAVEPAFKNGEIVRVKNDAVIYCLYPPPMAPLMASHDEYPAPMTYWSRAYTFDTTSQTFTVSTERNQVEPTTHYESVRAAQDPVPELTPRAACSGNADCGCGNHAATAAGEVTMDRKERIAALVANPHNTVKSLKMLEAATDDELKTLEDQAGTLKVAAEKATAATEKATADAAALVTAQTALKAAQDALAAPITEDRLPVAYRVAMAAQRAAETAEKDGLVAQLKAAQTTFTEDDLKAKDIPELKKLAALAKVDAPRDYSGLGVPRAAAANADLDKFAPPDPWAKDLKAAS